MSRSETFWNQRDTRVFAVLVVFELAKQIVRSSRSFPMNPDALKRLLEQLWLMRSARDEDLLLDALAAVSAPTVVCFANTHAINLARRDPAFFESLCLASYLIRDGSGVGLLCRLFGRPAGVNGCGTDVIPRLLSRYKGRPVALCGTAEPFVASAAAYAHRQGCQVVLAVDGFRSMDFYVDAIAAARPALVILGMGMPKQEFVARALAQRLDFPVTIVCGGAVLDYWAERFTRAPAFMRSIGAEWVYRFLLEPRRLWHRYLVGNASFLGWLLLMRLSHAPSSNENKANAPRELSGSAD
jgi:N-acetylglucosaminyldiphosphoundecaprenol N-acetyl-beta-D-mannosaminyltransferase